MTSLFQLDAAERRDAFVGFALLVGVMAAHALMETARDTLFLSRLPAGQLPWAYLTIAVLTLGAARLNHVLLPTFVDKRRLLAGTLLVAAAGTGVLWALMARGGGWGAFTLYVWAGLLATVVVVQVWLLLDDVVTVTQAKRVFGFVAVGAVLGATLGSLLADRLVGLVSARNLLLFAAGLMVLASATPLLWRPDRLANEPARRPHRDGTPGQTARMLFREPYLRALLVLIMASTVALTGVDFVFKSVVEKHIEAPQLGSFFARFYLVLNALSLVLQFVFSSWLLGSLGIGRALLIVPILLLLSSIGFALAPGLVAAVLVRGSEGSLRHTVHRTGLEVLYLPLRRDMRERYKALIDGVGGRGGQALASVAILVSVALGGSASHLAIGIAAVALAWLGIAVSLKGRYLELFRHNLREGTIETRVAPAPLDLRSLEALMTALNSEHDEEVLAALDLFEYHGKCHLIPVLVLYHPSRHVVVRALEMFAKSGRDDFQPVARRLLRSPDEHVRAAALRTLTVGAPDATLLLRGLEDASPVVYATALVALRSHGYDDADKQVAFARCLREGSAETRRALAMAIRARGDPNFASALLRLAESPELEVSIEVAEAMRAIPDQRYLPELVTMLARGRLRDRARRAIVAIGPKALSFLDDALWDGTVPRNVRRHLPRTVSRFEPRQAAAVLLRHLAHEGDGVVRYKILRGLSRLRADHPELPLDRRLVDGLVHDAIRRTLQIMDWRIATEKAQAADERLRTVGGELLAAVLREKEEHAIERVFLLLVLRTPREDFELLRQGLGSESRNVRAASREVLGHVLPNSMREAVLALVSEGPDEERLRRGTAAFGRPPRRPGYEGRLATMLGDRSEAVRAVTAYHIGELELTDLAPVLRQAIPTEPSPLAHVFEHALDAIGAERGRASIVA